ncbi:MAG: hypothetical protein ACK452_05050 [Bacteroidota bacterium]
MKIKLLFFLIIIFFGSCKSTIKEFRNEIGEVSVLKGEDFKILFNENHAEGQTWSLVQEFDSSILQYVKSFYHGPADGLTDFIFHAKAKGETILKFNLIEYSDVKRQAVIKIKIN